MHSIRIAPGSSLAECGDRRVINMFGDATRIARLLILDEPETGLSPQRQMALLCLLDELCRDGRSQALVATHSPILMSCPGSDRLWIDDDGVTRRALDDIPHWRNMPRFMCDPEMALRRLLL